jgi:O-antigen ligase
MASDKADAARLSAPLAESVAPPAEEPDPRWDWLLVCVGGYLLMAVGRVHQLFPVLETLRPAMLTGLLAIVMYLLDRREERRLRHLFVPATNYLVAFLIWMVLSVPGSLAPGHSFDFVFSNFMKTVLMYLVVAGAVRGLRDVERLAGVYLFGAAAYAGVVISRFDLGSGDDWRLGHLYYYDANDFATFVVTAMPFGLYFLCAGRRSLVRALAAVGLAVLTVGFVRAGSRGGLLALVTVVGFIVWRYTGITLRWRLGVTALVALVLVLTASPRYWEQMRLGLTESDYNFTEETGRIQVWQRGMGYMLQNPILGVGPNNFEVAEGTLSPFAARQQLGFGVRWTPAHNSYVQVGAELGIPGLVVFVAIIASAFGALRRSSRSAGADPQRSPQLMQALTASLIGFVVGAFFLSLAYHEILYTLVALAVGLERVTAKPAGHRS